MDQENVVSQTSSTQSDRRGPCVFSNPFCRSERGGKQKIAISTGETPALWYFELLSASGLRKQGMPFKERQFYAKDAQC